MDADNHGNDGGQHGFSEEKRLKIEWLDIIRNELQEEHNRLYIDFKRLHDRHENAAKSARELERNYLEVHNRTYWKRWRRFYEEEIASQELGASIRQYAEKVRQQRADVCQAIDRLLQDQSPR